MTIADATTGKPLIESDRVKGTRVYMTRRPTRLEY
jgi:hypothetical protein